MLQLRMTERMQQHLQYRRQRWTRASSLLDSVSPLNVVNRGYALVQKDGQIIKDTQQLRIGDKLNVRFAHGEAHAVVSGFVKPNL